MKITVLTLKAILTLLLYAVVTAFAILTVVNVTYAQSAQEVPVPPNFWDPRATADSAGVTPETIQFLATDDFPPFSFRDSTGRLTGFNIDLARAICEELTIGCTIRIKSFDALIPALVREEGDAIIAGLAPTPANLKTLRFSDAYLGLPGRFIAKKGGTIDPTPEGLTNKKIAVLRGTVHDAFLRKFFPQSEIVGFDTNEEARRAVAGGTVAAHFGDALSLSFWLNGEVSQGCCGFAGGPWLEPGYFDRGLSIAFRADDETRQQAVNFALRKLQAKGAYSELYLRYFPISFY